MGHTPMTAFREGFAPQMSDKALRALLTALESDDTRLIQGSTTGGCVKCESACAIAYAGWKGEELTSIEDVEGYFTDACSEASTILDDDSAPSVFLNWFDRAPRNIVRRVLAGEIRNILTIRQNQHHDLGGEG